MNAEHVQALRYERKFRVTELSSASVEAIIKLNRATFVERYAPRWINNIYLDSHALSSYRDNVEGLRDRVKVRIRWYGDLFGPVASPVLEYKLKHGFLGEKKRYQMPSFTVDEDFSWQALLADVNLPQQVMQNLHSLQPVLLNRYHRKYFESADGEYRLTLDDDMSFYRMSTVKNRFLWSSFDKGACVVELKYAPEHDTKARDITSSFPFRMTKNSKYVTGVMRLYQ